MLKAIYTTKAKLDAAIAQLSDTYWLFSKKPGRDFTRNRKLSFQKVVSCLLTMEGGTLTTELLKHFGCSANTASASALVQQRAKINSAAFPALFDLFIRKTDRPKRYKGFRLIAADGSDIQIPTNPNDPDSFFPGVNGQPAYSLLHLDAMYDLLQGTYVDATVSGRRKCNEQGMLCSMVDRSILENVLIIADRGFEGYNLLAHIQEKGWKFLIRVKEPNSPGGITSGLILPSTESFDISLNLSLTTKQSNDMKELFKDKNQYKLIPAKNRFDYLPLKNRKHDPASFYKLPFRVVRFQITDDLFETVVTNLDPELFPPDDLKRLYNMRWGIETSFRELKYTVGLLHFHAKKVEYIYQEIFARLIMYNFTELITSHVVISKASKKYDYKANFTVAVHVCRQFFLGNVSPPDVEALIYRHVSPIRPNRSRPRNLTVKRAVSFFYRVA